jgi:hypothetical protein
MKKYILAVIIMSISLITSAQKTETLSSVFVTPKRDTIYLQKKDKMAELLHKCWMMDSTWNHKNPAIVYVSETFITRKRKQSRK